MADKRPYIVIILRVDGTVEKLSQPKKPDLAQMQEIVGGYIETVPHMAKLEHEGTTYTRGIAFCNEEGRIKGLPINIQATDAWRACLGNGPFSYPPILHGNVLFYAKEPKVAP